MSGTRSGDGGAGNDERPKRDPEADAADGGAGPDESGYPRDDYWRGTARESTDPDEVPEPPQGYSFESTEEKAEAGEEADAGEADAAGASKRKPGPDEAAEQGNAGGRDDARIVDD